MSDEKEQQALTTARELLEIAIIIEGHDTMLAWLNRLGYVVVDKRPMMWGVIEGRGKRWLAENLTYSAAVGFALDHVLKNAQSASADVSQEETSHILRFGSNTYEDLLPEEVYETEIAPRAIEISNGNGTHYAIHLDRHLTEDEFEQVKRALADADLSLDLTHFVIGLVRACVDIT